jgi:hypothetical protein
MTDTERYALAEQWRARVAGLMKLNRAAFRRRLLETRKTTP